MDKILHISTTNKTRDKHTKANTLNNTFVGGTKKLKQRKKCHPTRTRAAHISKALLNI